MGQLQTILDMPEDQRNAVVGQLTNKDKSRLLYHWPFWARDNQLAPEGSWTYWLILAGRGFGKTRCGAEWVRDLVTRNLAGRIGLIAPTSADARDTMVEGESGLLNIFPGRERPHYEPSKRQITFSNGAIGKLYSAEEPERLRGPQHDALWADELCAWKYAEMAWDMAMFGLRLGVEPRACITTTPKPTVLLKSIMEDPHTHVTKGHTHDNLMNLAPTFREAILSKYEGTRLGRQELYAEVLEDVEGALWTRDMIQYVNVMPSGLKRILVAVDPPVTSGEKADECGIVVVGLAEDGKVYVIDDKSSQGDTPQGWAAKAVKAYYQYDADCIVAEVNNGGDLVEIIIRQCEGGQNAKYKSVRATRGKFIRAEPVAAIYEQGRVYHCGQLTALEDQMCSFTIDIDRKSMGSPDRVDALVWAIIELIGLSEAEPRIRTL